MPVEVEDLQFLKAHTTRTVKITVPGPFTMLQQAQNDFYPSEEEAAMDYAAAVNEEIRDLFAAGADIVQIDEPYMQARPEKARQYGLAGAEPRARRHQRHDCRAHLLRLRGDHPRSGPSGYSFLPELARLLAASRSRSRPRSRTSTCAVLAQARRQEDHGRLHRPVGHDGRDARRWWPSASAARSSTSKPEHVILAPDCGMKYLPREVA